MTDLFRFTTGDMLVLINDLFTFCMQYFAVTWYQTGSVGSGNVPDLRAIGDQQSGSAALVMRHGLHSVELNFAGGIPNFLSDWHLGRIVGAGPTIGLQYKEPKKASSGEHPTATELSVPLNRTCQSSTHLPSNSSQKA